MKKIHLRNKIYQVWNSDETMVMYQGTADECDKYIRIISAMK